MHRILPTLLLIASWTVFSVALLGLMGAFDRRYGWLGVYAEDAAGGTRTTYVRIRLSLKLRILFGIIRTTDALLEADSIADACRILIRPLVRVTYVILAVFSVLFLVYCLAHN